MQPSSQSCCYFSIKCRLLVGQVTDQDQQSSAPVPSNRSEALHGGAELDPLAPPSDQEGAPLLLTSASPQKPLQHRAGTASRAASAASSLAANPMLLSGSGSGMMTVVRTQFVPLGDSLSDSDSDSEVRLCPSHWLKAEYMGRAELPQKLTKDVGHSFSLMSSWWHHPCCCVNCMIQSMYALQKYQFRQETF